MLMYSRTITKVDPKSKFLEAGLLSQHIILCVDEVGNSPKRTPQVPSRIGGISLCLHTSDMSRSKLTGSFLGRVLEFDFFLTCCIGPQVCPTKSDATVDTSSEITTKVLKEKKEVVQKAESGRDAPANGDANEENGELEADNEVDKEGEGGEEEAEEEEQEGHTEKEA